MIASIWDTLNVETPSATSIRLLEDGDFRLLEDGSFRLLEDIPPPVIWIDKNAPTNGWIDA